MISDNPIILLGAGGHAGVIVDVLKKLNKTIIGFVAPKDCSLKGYPDIPYLGNDRHIQSYAPREINLVNGLGTISVIKNQTRRQIFEYFKQLGFYFATIIHPSAIIADSVLLDEGVQVMAGVVVQNNTHIFPNAIINTRAGIDHDCCIGHSVHVAPNATLSGQVQIGNHAFIGVSSTIIQGIHVGENAMINAGSVVTNNVLSFAKFKAMHEEF